MDRIELRGESGAHAENAARVVPQIVEAALAGRPTLLLLLGRNGEDVHSIIDSLVRPTALSAGVRDADIIEATGLAWEHDVERGVLERLGLDGVDPAKGLAKAANTAPQVRIIGEAADADAASLRALSSAVHRLHNAPLLVVVAAAAADPAYTQEEGVLGELRRAHRRTTVVIDALDAAAVREFASGLGVTLDDGVARRLSRHTDGSPSQIAELLTGHDPRAWRAPDAQIPATRSAMAQIRSILNRARPEVTALVEACAAIGRWIPIEEAGVVAELSDPLSVLDEAIALGLLEVRRASLRLLAGFPTRMARAAAYECMGVARQRALHVRAAEIMADPGMALRQRALSVGAPSADLAAELHAYAEKCGAEGAWNIAAEAWLAASRLSPEEPEQTLRLVASVDAEVSAGNLYDALALIPELERTVVSPQRDGVLGYHQLLLGHRDEAEILLNGAMRTTAMEPSEASGPQLSGEVTAVLAHRLALHALVDWDCGALVKWCEIAMAEAPDTVAGLEARTMYGLGLGGSGRSQEALDAYGEVTGQVRTGAQGQRALMGQGWLHLALDRVPLAAHELEMAAPTGIWHGSTRISLWANAWLAHARLALGDLRAAQAAVDRAIPMLEETGQNIALPLVHWAGAQIAALRGELDLAEKHAARAASVRTDYQGMHVAATMARASVALAHSDHTGVLRAFEQLAGRDLHPEIHEPGFWPWHDLYAMALVATGDPAAAGSFLKPHEALAEARQHRSTMARLGGVRGRVLFAEGDAAAGRAVFEQAIGQISDLPLPLLRAMLQFQYGQALRRIGKRRDAEGELYRARHGFAAMGATGYVERCDRELKAGSRTRDADSLTDLTPQEQAVVDLVLQGMTNREVAATLFISVKTVQYHLTRVYSRLGVRSRSELAALRIGT